jgi:hypothetical protein
LNPESYASPLLNLHELLKKLWSRSLHGSEKHYLFYFLLAVLFTSYYDSILDKPPMSYHIWRQADCLSISKKYEQGAPFFEPQMHCLFGDDNTTGKTAGEFPIMYYLIGRMWNVVGESFFSYRFVMLLYAFIALVLTYHGLMRHFNYSSSALFTIAIYTSPILIFYGVSFLTDAPAYFSILIGLFFLQEYRFRELKKLFWISMFFFAMAGLIKVSSLIAFVFLTAVLFFESLFKWKSLGKKYLFSNPILEISGFVSVYVALFLWYGYAAYYNDLHGFKYTFNSIFPYWEMKPGDSLIKGLKETILNSYYSPIALVFMGLLFIYNLISLRKLPGLLSLANILIPFGGAIYMVLWGGLLGYHDYYFIALLILFPVVWIPSLYLFSQNKNNQIYLSIALLIFTSYNVGYAYESQYVRVRNKIENPVFVNDHFYLEMLNYKRYGSMKAANNLMEVRKNLDSWGVQPEDRLISLPDRTFNYSLYMVNRDGWPKRRFTSLQPYMKLHINDGAKYALLNNIDEDLMEELKPYLLEMVGENNGIKLFRLRPHKE